ncbi:sigma-70 family RNA polymerase sigma factor [Arcticibacterium luteifluviistationis]|uniref:RNA polymerase subunit sigma n=1 Tax=Arcticibacterium luteifluviistationis TaxID=1784714 RepID=A0A2Z4GC15_9BACT|nr:sigma-70 family RNA polymerase sigma factor [Arcticibacterium luteifluviistationis]AWV98473.1 RNA polymerase subunit sigma [Arcticibacterium luteifluviistationis]
MPDSSIHTLEKSSSESITDWVRQYSDELYGWAVKKVGDNEIAKDLIQDTFLSAYKNISGFRYESSPKTWLFSILNFKIIDYYREKKKIVAISLEGDDKKIVKEVTDSMFDKSGNWETNGLEDSWNNQENLLDNSEFNEVMDVCMADLPDQWQQLLRLKYLLNKKHSEICQECDLSQSNYWQIIHRAKLMMKKCLEMNWFKN